MLWPSISRWKFQRSSIGKLPNSVCCLIVDCSATSTMLPASTPPSSSRRAALLRPELRGLHFRRASRRCRPASRTAAPRTRRSPRSAASCASRYLRRPFEHAHRNAKKPRGGVIGRRLGIGVDQAFEEAEHAGTPGNGVILLSRRGRAARAQLSGSLGPPVARGHPPPRSRASLFRAPEDVIRPYIVLSTALRRILRRPELCRCEFIRTHRVIATPRPNEFGPTSFLAPARVKSTVGWSFVGANSFALTVSLLRRGRMNSALHRSKHRPRRIHRRLELCRCEFIRTHHVIATPRPSRTRTVIGITRAASCARPSSSAVTSFALPRSGGRNSALHRSWHPHASNPPSAGAL